MPRDLRRKDRALSREEALRILSRGEYGVISTVSADGQPYGTPISFCVLDGSLYFHSAPEGQKLDNLSVNSKVSFCVVGRTQVEPEKFGTKYESVIVFGTATEVFDSEKRSALVGLITKYSKEFIGDGLRYIDSSSKDTRVYKISIDSITGKSKK
jgi:nitroimidazol reductase NimA-like FMN-containing flavoprotein (pyridoxamine 5'-phosphate oxidase superfamily)